MSLFSKIRGTIETLFQFGLSGPQLKNNSGAIEARDSADSTFATMRAAAGVSGNDVVVFTQLGGSSGTLTAPITVTTRTNTTNTVYVMDSTGGGPDAIILHNKSGAVTYRLPAPTAGRQLEVHDITGAIETGGTNGYAGGNWIFIAPNGAEQINGSTGFALTGTAYHFTNSNTAVSATGSKFTSELAVGMAITSSNQAGVSYIIASITDDTHLTLTANFTGTTTTTATSTRVSLSYYANFGELALKSDGTNWVASSNKPLRAKLTGNGTFIPEAGSTGGTVSAFGGGGGGGGGQPGINVGTTANVTGGGGGGGAEEITKYVPWTANTAIAVTIGAGGAHGPAASAGSPGAPSSFGTLLTALGASGGGGGPTITAGADIATGGAPYTADAAGSINIFQSNSLIVQPSAVTIGGAQEGILAVVAAGNCAPYNVVNTGSPGNGGDAGAASSPGASAANAGTAGNAASNGGAGTGGVAGTGGSGGSTRSGGTGGGGGGAGPGGQGGGGGGGGGGTNTTTHGANGIGGTGANNGTNGTTGATGVGGAGGTGGAANPNTGAGGGGGGGGGNGSTTGGAGGPGGNGGSGSIGVSYPL